MTNRVHIDAPAGVIDLEGEKEFIEGLLAKLFPLIEEAGFGSRPQVNAAEPITVSESGTEDAKSSESSNAKGKTRTRRTTKRPPPGHSCGDRILTLKTDGFFKQKRNTSEIVQGLAEKGWTHNSSQVSAAAGDLFNKKGELQRTLEGKTPLYFWDRD